MAWATLRSQVKTLVEANSDIQEVVGYPKIKFNGYPAAYVVPSDNSGDYETTQENIRTYAFLVRVFYETKQSGVETAISALEGIIDDLLDAFDQEDLKGASSRTLGISLPTGYTFINVWATPAQWSEIVGEELIMAELRVRLRVSIDIT